MENLETLVQLILGMFGVGGLTKIITTWQTSMRGEGRPLTEKTANKIEAASAAQNTGLLSEWEKYASEMGEQNRTLWDQNKALWVQNRELTEQNTLLREASAEDANNRLIALNYIQDLRAHINRELGPPPPQWPDTLYR